MKDATTERKKRFREGRGGRWKCLENRKKILNSGNQPKNVLKTHELTISEAQNKLLFEPKKPRSNPKTGQKSAIGGRRTAFRSQEKEQSRKLANGGNPARGHALPKSCGVAPALPKPGGPCLGNISPLPGVIIDDEKRTRSCG